MKKHLIAFAIIVSSYGASAQINKGQVMVGGNLSFNSSKYGDVDESKITTFQFNPNIGYFFIDNLAGGLRLSFSSIKEEGEEDAYSELLAAPFVRYYWLPATQKVNVFADASYGFGSVGTDDKTSFNQWSVMVGPAIFLTPNTALEFSVGYTSKGGDAYTFTTLDGDEKRYNNIGINVGFQIHLGGVKSK